MPRDKIEKLLQQHMGLDANAMGQTAIERAIRTRRKALELEDEEYWEKLCSSEEELQELIEIIVVPETWFFRDEEAFKALIHVVVNEWLSGMDKRRLRVLSLPCATGEEPYSIAMALLDAGVPPQSFDLFAVDISRRSLRYARRGTYRPHSFRGREKNSGYKLRYFVPTEEGFEVKESIRRKVRWIHGNVFDLAPILEARDLDVIFCRNMLIYFDQASQQAAIQRLTELLRNDGVLFVGPAEAFLVKNQRFEQVFSPSAFAFRKRPAHGESEFAYDSRSVAKSDASVRKKLHPVTPKKVVPKTPAVPKAVLPVTPPSQPAQVKSNHLEEARQLADSGRFAEADVLCQSYLREHGPSAPAFYLLGLVCEARGQGTQATDCYRKALYLEPDNSEVLTHLALLLKAQGDSAGARRLQARIQRQQEEKAAS